MFFTFLPHFGTTCIYQTAILRLALFRTRRYSDQSIELYTLLDRFIELFVQFLCIYCQDVTINTGYAYKHNSLRTQKRQDLNWVAICSSTSELLCFGSRSTFQQVEIYNKTDKQTERKLRKNNQIFNEKSKRKTKRQKKTFLAINKEAKRTFNTLPLIKRKEKNIK